MTSPKIGQTISNVTDNIRNGYQTRVKPKIASGYQYTTGLKNDVVDFVKKNPKKTGAAAFLTFVGLAAAGFVAKHIKTLHDMNKIKSEHIEHQREIIDALKDDIADKQFMLDTRQDIIDAYSKKK